MLVTIFGKRGSGKTTLIKGNLDEFPGPVCVIDVLGNFDDPDQFHITSQTSEFIEWVQAWHEEPDEHDKIFVLQPADPTVALDYVSAALWELGGGTLVLDEVDSFDYFQAPCFDQVIRYGRNRNIHLVTGARRPAEVSKNLTAGANRIFVLRTQEPRDIEYYEKTILGERSEELMKMKEFTGFLIDYDAQTISIFDFDEAGNIAILQSNPF